MEDKTHAMEEQPDGSIIPVETTGNKSASVTGYTLGDYDRWFKPCEHCGYDTGKASDTMEARCWKCGRPIQRDYSERALKKKSV